MRKKPEHMHEKSLPTWARIASTATALAALLGGCSNDSGRESQDTTTKTAATTSTPEGSYEIGPGASADQPLAYEYSASDGSYFSCTQIDTFALEAGDTVYDLTVEGMETPDSVIGNRKFSNQLRHLGKLGLDPDDMPVGQTVPILDDCTWMFEHDGVSIIHREDPQITYWQQPSGDVTYCMPEPTCAQVFPELR